MEKIFVNPVDTPVFYPQMKKMDADDFPRILLSRKGTEKNLR